MDVRQILVLAVEKEQAAHDMYARAAVEARDPSGQALLEELAAQELEHRELLAGIDPDHLEEFEPEEQHDLRLSEHLRERAPAPHSGLQDLLCYAMRREQEARDFYRRMAEHAGRPELKELFDRLAAMENKHRARLEEFYEAAFTPES
jgi:rubrerythrin